MTPNPGSNAAIEQGCTCPVLAQKREASHHNASFGVR